MTTDHTDHYVVSGARRNLGTIPGFGQGSMIYRYAWYATTLCGLRVRMSRKPPDGWDDYVLPFTRCEDCRVREFVDALKEMP